MTSLPIESLKLVDEDPKRHSGAPGDANRGLNFSGTYYPVSPLQGFKQLCVEETGRLVPGDQNFSNTNQNITL